MKIRETIKTTKSEMNLKEQIRKQAELLGDNFTEPMVVKH